MIKKALSSFFKLAIVIDLLLFFMMDNITGWGWAVWLSLPFMAMLNIYIYFRMEVRDQ